MKDKVTLSIIIPVYNVREYLKECLDSVFSQRYQDYEVIIVDDGSTDGSGKICDELTAGKDNCKVIHSENQGLAKARNLGIDHSCGEYLGFVDSDDMIHPQMYEILLQEAKESGVDTITCQYCSFKNAADIAFPDYNDNNVSFRRLISEDVIKNYWTEAFMKIGVPQWGSIYKSSMFKKFNVCTMYRYYEDLNTQPDILENSSGFSCTDIPLYYYRDDGLSITRSPMNQAKVDRLGTWKNRIIPFLERHCDENSIKKGYKTYIDWYELIAQKICKNSKTKMFIPKEYRNYLFRLLRKEKQLGLHFNKESLYMMVFYCLLVIDIKLWYRFVNRKKHSRLSD